MVSGLLDLLFPEDCPACQAPALGVGLCAACAGDIPQRLRPLPDIPGIATAWALGPYEGALGALVRRGKYRPDPIVLGWLGQRLAAAAGGRLPRAEAVCWTPVPTRRRVTRGFDQAELLARPVAGALGVPLWAGLRRVRPLEQAGRPRSERATGARGAFAVAPRGSAPETVLLVDDVVTTGATARACAEELLCSGARRVHLLCVASALA